MKRFISAMSFCLLMPALARADLMVCDSGTGDRVMLFSSQDGSLIDADWITDIGAVGWAFTTPKEARIVGNEIWVSDQVTDAIHRFDMNRNYVSSITLHFDGLALDNLRGFGTDGTSVYLTVFPTTATRRGVVVYDLAGTATAFLPIASSLFDVEPFGGDLLISNEGPDNIERWTTGGVFLNNFATGVVFPQQVEILSDNSVLTVSSIANPGIEGVYHYDSGGTLIRFIDTQPAKNTFGELVPRGAYLLGDGNYIITASTGVYKYDVVGDTFSQIIAGVNAQYVTPGPSASACAMPGDMDANTLLNGFDVEGFVACMLGGGSNCACADIDNSQTIDQVDVQLFAALLVAP